MRKDKQAIEIYIHIPFCIRKCNYCDFLSFPGDEKTIASYVDALIKEIRLFGLCGEENGKKKRVSTIFIGGGTPSILSAEQIKEIMLAVCDTFAIEEDAEISMECNPGTLSYEKLLAYKEAGINRLSLGLQSTDNACLETLGRIHTYEEFLENYHLARKAGFDNINIDLMSALPGQTLEQYSQGLEEIMALKPEHISSYSLILEEGTPFYEDDAVYDALPLEEEERAMYEKTKTILEKHGYHRYEISNYALEGKACKHNLGYWSGIPYLGFGLGASSYDEGKVRYRNVDDLSTYIECIKQISENVSAREASGKELDDVEHGQNDVDKMMERLHQERTPLSKEAQMEEYMFLGLRKMEGVSIRKFYDLFSCEMETIYGPVIRSYRDLALLEVDGDWLRLTEAGIDVSNRIFSEFLLSV